MFDLIKKFKVGGKQYQLDLDEIGAYVGGELVKSYIDSHGGGTGGGKEILIFKYIDGEDFYNQGYYNKIMAAFDEGGLTKISDTYEVHIVAEFEDEDRWNKLDIIPTEIMVDDVNRFVFFKCFVQLASDKAKVYSWVLMPDGGGLHTIQTISYDNRGAKEVIYLNDRSQDEYVELFNRLRSEMVYGNFPNYEFYWRINAEDGSCGRIIRMTDVDVSQENWLVFGGLKAAFANSKIQVAIMNDGVCYVDETQLGQ